MTRDVDYNHWDFILSSSLFFFDPTSTFIVSHLRSHPIFNFFSYFVPHISLSSNLVFDSFVFLTVPLSSVLNIGTLYYKSPGIITLVIKKFILFSIPSLHLNETSFNTNLSWCGQHMVGNAAVIPNEF